MPDVVFIAKSHSLILAFVSEFQVSQEVSRNPARKLRSLLPLMLVPIRSVDDLNLALLILMLKMLMASLTFEFQFVSILLFLASSLVNASALRLFESMFVSVVSTQTALAVRSCAVVALHDG